MLSSAVMMLTRTVKTTTIPGYKAQYIGLSTTFLFSKTKSIILQLVTTGPPQTSHQTTDDMPGKKPACVLTQGLRWFDVMQKVWDCATVVQRRTEHLTRLDLGVVCCSRRQCVLTSLECLAIVLPCNFRVPKIWATSPHAGCWLVRHHVGFADGSEYDLAGRTRPRTTKWWVENAPGCRLCYLHLSNEAMVKRATTNFARL